MSKSRKWWLVVALAVVGLALTLGQLRPSPGSTDLESEQLAKGRVARASLGSSGRIAPLPTRHASSAARDTEGHHDDDWDQLGRAGRLARTEQGIAALELELQATNDTQSRARIRTKAQRILSQARADYFLDQDGQLRYLELEATFED